MDSGAEGDAARARTRAGILYSLSAYTIWGLLPLYLQFVRRISAFEFLLHRMLWSAVFVGLILARRKQWAWLARAFRDPKVLVSGVASALVLAVNWFLFVWSATSGHIIDASLGYFINPLLSILFGAVLLKEHLSRGRWLGVGLAAAGVVWLTIQFHHLPWIGLCLAASFGTYGLLRKVAALGALEGLALETLLLSPVALVVLAIMATRGNNQFVAAPWSLRGLVLLAGPITAVPLLLFAAGARRIPLSLLGLLQYIGPTLQLLCGIWVGHEVFRINKATGYALIWLGFLVASIDGLWSARSRQMVPAVPAARAR